MNEKETIGKDVVDILLKEYETLRAEVLQRLEAESQIQLYSIAALGGLIPLLEYIDNVNSHGGNASFLLLLSAFIFCALGLHQVELENGVVEIGNYLQFSLSLNIKKTLNSKSIPVFEWESKWRANRQNKFAESWLGLSVLSKFGIPPISALILLINYFYIEHVLSAHSWQIFEVFAITIVLACIVWIIISGILLKGKYENIATK